MKCYKRGRRCKIRHGCILKPFQVKENRSHNLKEEKAGAKEKREETKVLLYPTVRGVTMKQTRSTFKL